MLEGRGKWERGVTRWERGVAGWERGVARWEKGVAGGRRACQGGRGAWQGGRCLVDPGICKLYPLEYRVCRVLCLQAERLMEAIELCKEEQTKLAEHRERCATARKEVGASSVPW